jgi:hypothetical protein
MPGRFKITVAKGMAPANRDQKTMHISAFEDEHNRAPSPQRLAGAFDLVDRPVHHRINQASGYGKVTPAGRMMR